MHYELYSDESGTSNKEKCYTIGAILVPKDWSFYFAEFLNSLVKKHKIQSEIKWEKVNNSYNIMNFAIDVLKELQKGPFIFTCIVVLKSAYIKWQVNQEEAFYTTYTLLLEHIAKELKGNIDANMDNRTDSYSKQNEVVEIISNHKLKKCVGSVAKVTKVDSKKLLELQAVDILTGAVNASHHLYINPKLQINAGKLLLIDRLSSILGLDALHYDTYPNAAFNIWHFPWREYRGVPKTTEIKPDLSIPYITIDDMKIKGI